MLQFMQSLSPEEQAALVGLVVTAMVYLVRHAEPAWFSNEDETAKFQRTASVVLLSGLGVMLKTVSAGTRTGAGAFLLAWALAYATAEGAHTVVSRSSALRD